MDPRSLIDQLGLAPHPEGGWYRETWRGTPGADGRAQETAIYFLLEHGQASHWHRVDATEIWCWHAGQALELKTAPDDSGPVVAQQLGPNFEAGQTPQIIVPRDHWQAAHAANGWALVSCIVSPGFQFEGFVLAPAGWGPGAEE